MLEAVSDDVSSKPPAHRLLKGVALDVWVAKYSELAHGEGQFHASWR